MPLFSHENRERNAATRRVYAAYEIAHTAVDFLAAISFLVGSVLFLFPDYEGPAVWLFIVGSVFFCMKPTLRLAREIQLWRMGQIEELAGRMGE
ncbi:YrhK-like protein [Lutimaribacter pacificus]|uniref:YrhK-like protein n=1 Tax=Lutimaribacter pacificus TaxID=391948 RepID=A0A1H0EWU5_9RHOB|nr:YrhK family protein [Lutimaribacter pacificus]SDN86838.1 YrhK-like protein [Lutimaribacter pacificus]SHK42052.1 YrhK-like protein [Lutimaribacter pacificus]